MTFKAQLENRIRKTVHTLRRDGTTAMSLNNLFYLVSPPPRDAEGAPCSPDSYRRMFAQVAQGCAGSFVMMDDL